MFFSFWQCFKQQKIKPALIYQRAAITTWDPSLITADESKVWTLLFLLYLDYSRLCRYCRYCDQDMGINVTKTN